MPKLNGWQIVQITILLICVVICAVLFVGFFQQIPITSNAIAIDWKQIWPSIEGGTVRYSTGLKFAPWSAFLVSPLGLLSLSVSWGLMAFITVFILLLSVPRVRQNGRYLFSIVLLMLSFPSLRHMIDGNFEGLIIAGALLSVYGYNYRQPYALAAGMLLIASKPQTGTLLFVTIGLYALLQLKQAEQRRFWITTALVVIIVVIPFLIWKGSEWLNAMFGIAERGSIMDVSLLATLNRTGVIPSILVFILWSVFVIANLIIIWRTRSTLNREKAGMLIAASLLIAPYAAGNSLLTVLAVGVIPLFQVRPRVGLILIVLIDCLFLWNKDMLYYYQATFQDFTLLTIWAVLAWRTLAARKVATFEPATKLASAAQ